MHTNKNLPQLALLLAALGALGPFSIDTYLPAFHEIGASLKANPEQVQLTLTAYMGTFALMSLWHGALSGAFGRRKIILIFTALYGVASLACALAQNIEMLWFGRALQGLCGGAGVVIGRAIIRDIYEGPHAQRAMSRVTMIFVLAPAIAPIIGGLLLLILNWRSIFIFLAALGFGLTIWCARTLPETLTAQNRQVFRFAPLLEGYLLIFKNPGFMLLSLALALNFNAFFLYILSSPEFLIKHLGVSAQGFAWLFVPSVLGLMSGAFISGKVAGKWSSHRSIQTGFIIMASAVGLNIALNLFVSPSLPWFVLPIMIFNTGMTLASPSLTILNLDIFPTRRGMAASCQTSIQITLNALNSAFIAPFFWSKPLYLSLGMALFFTLAWLCLFLKNRAYPQ